MGQYGLARASSRFYNALKKTPSFRNVKVAVKNCTGFASPDLGLYKIRKSKANRHAIVSF
jgi:hypothetical protein